MMYDDEGKEGHWKDKGNACDIRGSKMSKHQKNDFLFGTKCFIQFTRSHDQICLACHSQCLPNIVSLPPLYICNLLLLLACHKFNYDLLINY